MHTCRLRPLWGNLTFFLSKVINPIKRVFTMGSEHCVAFKYLGLNINQSNSEIIRDQVNNKKSVDYIAISNDRKNPKKMTCCGKKKMII